MNLFLEETRSATLPLLSTFNTCECSIGNINDTSRRSPAHQPTIRCPPGNRDEPIFIGSHQTARLKNFWAPLLRRGLAAVTLPFP